MFIVMPTLRREVNRQIEFIDPTGEPQVDYSLGRTCMEIPLGSATLFGGDPKKLVTRAKEQDVLTLRPKVLFKPVNRIVLVECHPQLYVNGVPVFRRIYNDGELACSPITWTVTKDTDLSKLPYLFSVYICDQFVR